MTPREYQVFKRIITMVDDRREMLLSKMRKDAEARQNRSR